MTFVEPIYDDFTRPKDLEVKEPTNDNSLMWRRTDTYADIIPVFIEFIGILLTARGVKFELLKDGSKIVIRIYLFKDSVDSYSSCSIDARDVVQGEFLNFFKSLYKALNGADSDRDGKLVKIEDY